MRQRPIELGNQKKNGKISITPKLKFKFLMLISHRSNKTHSIKIKVIIIIQISIEKLKLSKRFTLKNEKIRLNIKVIKHFADYQA